MDAGETPRTYCLSRLNAATTAATLPETDRVQLTTDTHKMYFSASGDSFGPDLDYAMLFKKHENMPHAPETVPRHFR